MVLKVTRAQPCISRMVTAQSGGSLAAVAATQSTAVAGVPRQSASSPCSPRCRDARRGGSVPHWRHFGLPEQTVAAGPTSGAPEATAISRRVTTEDVGSPDRCRQGLVQSQRLPHGVDESYLCLCPRALCSRMSTRSSARAGVRPRRCPAPCPEKETVGFICRHASPPRHLRLFYGLCAHIKSGSLPKGLFPPGPAHSPRSSYTSVSGVRNRVRISWRYRMATGSRSIRN